MPGKWPGHLSRVQRVIDASRLTGKGILVVLLQQGRGGGLGGAFGGQTQQVFGGHGAGNFMTRVTWACAMVLADKGELGVTL